jgi:hypothetical protein
MKLTQMFLLAISLTLPAFALADEHAGHQKAEHKHEAASHPQLTLNDGKKWHADQAMRQAMANIRNSVSTAVPAIHAGKLKPAQFEALGKEIEGQIAYIVQNCKLAPKADEQLHILLGSITSGLEIATAKQSNKKRASGIHQIAQSLNDYGKYFDHPDWQMIALSGH